VTDVLKLHSDLVAIPSLSREEKEVADLLSAYAESNGIPCERMGDNVIMHTDSDITTENGGPTLLLNSHLDVVPASADHPFDAFTPTLQDGNMFGRGSVDAKASVASMTTAVASLIREGWHPANGKLMLALTVCEELGGMDNGLEAVLPELPAPDAAIVGEPTGMEPCIAQKGLLILKMISHGKTAHAARSHLGVNAIEMAARDVQRVTGITFDRVHPFLGETTLTPTTIEGGSARNVVPDRCVVYLDIRTTPVYSHAELTSMLAPIVESEMSVHSDRLVPVDTDPSESIVQACISANPGATPFGSPTLSDWIYLSGTPAVKMGPGNSDLSHTANEHIAVTELEKSVDIYRNAIKHFFS
jgi:acetylornithine deacetylase